MYKQVNWDSKLPKKWHAPVTTFEAGKADPLKENNQNSITPELAQVYKKKFSLTIFLSYQLK
jgi:hypothetical protein